MTLLMDFTPEDSKTMVALVINMVATDRITERSSMVGTSITITRTEDTTPTSMVIP